MLKAHLCNELCWKSQISTAQLCGFYLSHTDTLVAPEQEEVSDSRMKNTFLSAHSCSGGSTCVCQPALLSKSNYICTVTM